MSLFCFCSRISKLCARRANSCFFSSLPQSPYLLFNVTGEDSPEGRILTPRFLDPTKKDYTVCGAKILLPKDTSHEICVGASQGWMMRCSGLRLHLTDGFKPWVSSARVISLPDVPLGVKDYNQIMSLSSSEPGQDDDCFVATKFVDSLLSVCRSRDAKWTHIDSPGINKVLPASTITYSKRYKAFFFTSPKGFYLGSVDLSNRNNYNLKYHCLHLRNIPTKIRKKWIVIHDTCKMSEHLVDSPSGDLFFILWYTTYMSETFDTDPGGVKETLIEPKRFMVFREDEKTKEFNYTDDIGDLCIFLGRNEAFCVSANMYPGLRPNSIYYTYSRVGPSLGCYSLASAKSRTSHPIIRYGSYWIHPADPIAEQCSFLAL